MKTAYYTFTTWNNGAMAAGFDRALSGERQASMIRQPGRQKARGLGGDNVIDLTAWRAANLAALQAETEDGDWEDAEDDGLDLAVEPSEPPAVHSPRPRGNRRAAFVTELACTIGVAVLALALVVRVLAF